MIYGQTGCFCANSFALSFSCFALAALDLPPTIPPPHLLRNCGETSKHESNTVGPMGMHWTLFVAAIILHTYFIISLIEVVSDGVCERVQCRPVLTV